MRAHLLFILLIGFCTGANITFVTYHILQPQFTGVASKNTGDVKGDIQFVTGTMHTCKGNVNGKCMRDQMFETVQVTVDVVNGQWGKYLFCNIQADIGEYVCCDNTGHPPCPPLSSCAAGREAKKNGGYWYSFPECGEGSTWWQGTQRQRINASCVGDLWRTRAGGCPECSSALDECVQYCVTNKTSLEQRQIDWYKATTDGTVCPQHPWVPPPSHWKCGAKGTCVQAHVGHLSQANCAASCTLPSPDTQYLCGGFGDCFQAEDKGDYPKLGDCEAACSSVPTPAPPLPPPTPPTPQPKPPPKPPPTPSPTGFCGPHQGQCVNKDGIQPPWRFKYGLKEKKCAAAAATCGDASAYEYFPKGYQTESYCLLYGPGASPPKCAGSTAAHWDTNPDTGGSGPATDADGESGRQCWLRCSQTPAPPKDVFL